MLITLLVTTLLVALTVIIHFEALRWLSAFMQSPPGRFRMALLVCMFGAMVAHVIEIWVFGLGYCYLTQSAQVGSLEGGFTHTLSDCGYYSFVTYTTLGFGDLIPKGPIRFLTGMEALTGLLLITWTASFMYIQMQQGWKTNSSS
jgi:hypothetical protein